MAWLDASQFKISPKMPLLVTVCNLCTHTLPVTSGEPLCTSTLPIPSHSPSPQHLLLMQGLGNHRCGVLSLSLTLFFYLGRVSDQVAISLIFFTGIENLVSQFDVVPLWYPHVLLTRR